jgi:type IV pilus assembly protein PilP
MRTLTKKRNDLIPLPFALISVLFLFMEAWASQEVVYKGPRPEQVISERKANAQVSSPDGYFYNPAGKTDPFKSFIAEQEAFEEKKVRKPRTYLETLDLSQLELVAVILHGKESWAMVRDSKGLGHVIKEGTLIGTNEGVVHQITEGKVIIREKYKDFRGKEVIKDIPKKLPSLQ